MMAFVSLKIEEVDPMLYRLSKFISVFFRTRYRDFEGRPWRARWIQWRGHVLWQRHVEEV